MANTSVFAAFERMWQHILIAINNSESDLQEQIDKKIDINNLNTAIDSALSQAKASGEFDGKDGYSPIRGTDYWTDTDKAEIKAYVDEAILGGAW